MTRLEAALVELAAAIRDEVAASVGPNADPPERLLSVDEARAAMGGIARSTLYELIANDQVRTITIGRRRLIPSSAIGEYAARGR